MSVRRFSTRSFILAAAAATALPLSAPERRPSDQRISTSKGEVMLPPRVDTVYVTRYDTVRVTQTRVRVDTQVVAQPVPVPIPHNLSDWFWSAYAGASAPLSQISDLYTAGYHFGLAGGWDPRDSWFGARMSVTYSQFGRDAGFPIFRDFVIDDPVLFDRDLDGGTPSTWAFNLDLKAKYPTGGWSPYLLGGLGFNTYQNLATVEDLSDRDDVVFLPDEDLIVLEDRNFCRLDNDVDLNEVGTGDNVNCFRLPDDNTNFNWSFGVGTDFHIGTQDMFFELRWNPIATHGSWTWYMPISLGVRFF